VVVASLPIASDISPYGWCQQVAPESAEGATDMAWLTATAGEDNNR